VITRNPKNETDTRRPDQVVP